MEGEEEIALGVDSDGEEALGDLPLELEDFEELEDPFGDWEWEWAAGDRVPTVPEFRPPDDNTGVKGELLGTNPINTTVLQCFKLYFPDSSFQTMTEETNRYAHQLIESRQLKDHSRFANFRDVTIAEMKCFIALVIGMGLLQQQNLQDYWCMNEVVSTPFFPKIFSRDRFQLILSVFHLSDNTRAIGKGQPGYTPLQKLGTPYQVMAKQFGEVYTPTQHVAIDEGMIPWRGNLSFRVYNPNKPDKYGVKVFLLCDAVNGYCCQLEIYAGKTADVSDKGATYDLVWRLIDPYLHCGYQLFVDNYYSSPQLFMDLYCHNTGATGTLRTNRKGVPVQIKTARLKEKGEKLVMHSGPLVIMKLHDRKVVTVLSTIHTTQVTNTERRNWRGEVIEKPHCIAEYNKYMGAVDVCDQMVQYESFRRRTLKWWKKVFFHLVGLACLNAFLVYKQHTKSKMEQRVFRRTLVSELVADAGVLPERKRGRPPLAAQENMMRLNGRHFPSKVKKNGLKNNPARQCAVCNLPSGKRHEGGGSRKRKESTYECEECNVGLCATPCFGVFHMHSDYKLAYRRLNVGDRARVGAQ